MKQLIRFVILGLLVAPNVLLRADDYMYAPVPVVEWAAASDKCFIKTGVNQLEVYDLAGKLVWSQSKVVFEAEFSPDGNLLAYAVPSEGIYIYSFASKIEKLAEPKTVADTVSNLHWLPNGSKLAYWNHASGYSELHTINVDGSGLKVITKQQRPKFPDAQ